MKKGLFTELIQSYSFCLHLIRIFKVEINIRMINAGPVGWGSRIHRLHLYRGVRPPPYECPVYDAKQSNGESSVMLELCGIRSTPSLPSLPDPLWLDLIGYNLWVK